MSERYCVNCVHYAVDPAQCHTPGNVKRDMVSGQLVGVTTPAAMRDGPCGKEGLLFVQKPTPEPIRRLSKWLAT